MCLQERWGAGVETQKNVRGEIGGWGRVPLNEPYAPSLSTIYDGAQGSLIFLKMVLDPSPPPLACSSVALLVTRLDQARGQIREQSRVACRKIDQIREQSRLKSRVKQSRVDSRAEQIKEQIRLESRVEQIRLKSRLAQDASRCRSLSAKKPLGIGLF